MGFTQLLAANRSLRNIKDGPSRYKMTQANLLPKFGAEKDAREAKPCVAGTVAAGGIAKADVPFMPVAAERASRAPVPAPGGVRPVSQKTLQPSRVWPRFRNPFGGAAGKSEPAPVQTEMLLETVKPVRNSLGDDEFEPARIPRDAVRAAATAPVAAPIRPAEASGFWSRWKARLFGVAWRT
jgi:hypothetical protein